MSSLGRSRQRGVAALVAAVIALSASACNVGHTAVGSEENPPRPTATDSARTDVYIAVTNAPLSLDFTTQGGAAIPQLLLNNVYETLIKVDQDGTLIPLLATSWELSADRTEYTFHLRQGVTFSDGRPFTAADVVASFDRVQTDWTLNIARQFDVVERTEAIDTYTVRVTLARPSNSWLFSAATSLGAIFPADLEGIDLRTTTVGTGPFEVTSLLQGDRAVLAGRSDHWAGPAALTQVTVRYGMDPTSAVNALRAGDVDMVFNAVTGDQVRQLEAQGGYQVLVGTSTGEMLLSFNNRVAPFDDIRVRRALSYAIDREAAMETISAGFGTLIATMVTPQDPFFEDLTYLLPFDPERARELLAEAGFGPDNPLRIEFDIPSIPYASTGAELLVSQLADVGVQVTVNTLEFPAVWLDQVFLGHNFQMSFIMHSEARDLLTIMSSTSYVGYDDSAILPLATAADAGTWDEYVAGMKEVARRIVADVPSLVLYLAPTLIVADPGLAGIRPNAVTESMDLTTLHWATGG